MSSLRHLGLLVLLLSISPLFAATNRILVLPAVSGGSATVRPLEQAEVESLRAEQLLRGEDLEHRVVH